MKFKSKCPNCKCEIILDESEMEEGIVYKKGEEYYRRLEDETSILKMTYEFKKDFIGNFITCPQCKTKYSAQEYSYGDLEDYLELKEKYHRTRYWVNHWQNIEYELL